jgi:hypothetical protein
MKFHKHFKARNCSLKLGASSKEGVLCEVVDSLVSAARWKRA